VSEQTSTGTAPARTANPVDDLDRDALARIAQGQLDALEELYERYRTVAYSIALRITSEPSAAEDVVQEAFLGAWRNAARYTEARATVRTWLLAIVHHRAIDAVRRRRPTAELPELDAVPPPAMWVPDVWGEVSGRLDQDTVRAALAELSEVQREALELAYFGGLTQQEIAIRTGTPLGTVKSRMRLGLLSLRRILTGQGEGLVTTLGDERAWSTE
jgi:RNA polymerase sigma-70 factor (ECF subfamily)